MLTSASINLLGNVHVEIQLLSTKSKKRRIFSNNICRNTIYRIRIGTGDADNFQRYLIHGEKIEFVQHVDFSGLFDFYDTKVIFVSLNNFQKWDHQYDLHLKGGLGQYPHSDLQLHCRRNH